MSVLIFDTDTVATASLATDATVTPDDLIYVTALTDLIVEQDPVFTISSPRVDIINYGNLTATEQFGAVFLGSDFSTLVNMPTGGIFATQGVSASGGLSISGDDVTISNAGTIGAEVAVFLREADGAVVNNSGTIVATTPGPSAGAIVVDSALTTGVYGTTINNTGLIQGNAHGSLSDNLAIFVTNVATLPMVLNNAGTITGDILSFNAGAQTYNNTGTITGDIKLSDTSAGADIIRNNGEVTGDVEMGQGDDLYDGLTEGIVGGAIRGQAGNDTLRGSNAAEFLDGGDATDTITARGGDDTVMGGTGADIILGGDGNDFIDGEVNDDVVNGNAGDDTIEGGSGADDLRGGRDDDVIRGGSGDDLMRGDSGDDLMIGQAGRDDMFGGGGNDLFIFEQLSDSGLGAARDRIYDFRSGTDTLDVTGLAGGVISFIGAANFSATGGRELRAVSVTNGTLIYIDTDGDGTRDSDIYLIGTDSVVEGDFLL